MNGRGRTAVPSSLFPVPSGRRGRAAGSRKGPSQKQGGAGEKKMAPDFLSPCPARGYGSKIHFPLTKPGLYGGPRVQRDVRGGPGVGRELQEKQIRKSQVLAGQGLTLAIFIFKAKNCHRVEGEHERRSTAGRSPSSPLPLRERAGVRAKEWARERAG
jgi:hypothetical protein